MNDGYTCDERLSRDAEHASRARQRRDRLAACLSPHEWLQRFDGVLVRREDRSGPDLRFDLQHCVSPLVANAAT